MSIKNWAKGDNSRSCIQPLKLTQWKGRGTEAGFEYPQNTKETLKKLPTPCNPIFVKSTCIQSQKILKSSTLWENTEHWRTQLLITQ